MLSAFEIFSTSRPISSKPLLDFRRGEVGTPSQPRLVDSSHQVSTSHGRRLGLLVLHTSKKFLGQPGKKLEFICRVTSPHGLARFLRGLFSRSGPAPSLYAVPQASNAYEEPGDAGEIDRNFQP
jgi:hypothetical protein